MATTNEQGEVNGARWRVYPLREAGKALRHLVVVWLAKGAKPERMRVPPEYSSTAKDRAAYAKGAARAIAEREQTPQAPISNGLTFAGVRELWTSGELHRLPDHVKSSGRKDKNGSRAKHVEPVTIDGVRFGDMPVTSIRIEHCEHVMASLPKTLAPLSRRHVAQVMLRVLSLAAYPLRLIAASPLPRGWLPKVGKVKAKGCLYPDEERALLACVDVPLEHRVLYGFLAREGMRKGEALALTWSDIDLARGAIKLDVNKTDDPRAWALSPDVTRALTKWKKLAPKRETVFYIAHSEHLASQLRDHLKLAGVKRSELDEKSATRIMLRAHDFRALFVTSALANDKSEAWVSDRTGHRSSLMINRYRRQARTLGELGLGVLAPLDETIPELNDAKTPNTPPTPLAKTKPETVLTVSLPFRGVSQVKSHSPKNSGRGNDFNPVRGKGLEPLRLSAVEPKSTASAIPPPARVTPTSNDMSVGHQAGGREVFSRRSIALPRHRRRQKSARSPTNSAKCHRHAPGANKSRVRASTRRALVPGNRVGRRGPAKPRATAGDYLAAE